MTHDRDCLLANRLRNLAIAIRIADGTSCHQQWADACDGFAAELAEATATEEGESEARERFRYGGR